LDRWERVKEGMGQVVLLSGEAGIGKSRLLQVLKGHLEGELHTTIENRCSPYYQNSSYKSEQIKGVFGTIWLTKGGDGPAFC